jgi:imidazolonepropionase-like amidohydrolase
VRKAVREQIAAGADWIKVYADYRRRPGVPATPTFSLAELEAAVDEARSAGLKVAAHATTDAAMARCVAAGVATLEHGDGASEATLRAMQQKGVALVPTLAAVEAIARQAGWQPGTPEPERLRRARATVALAHKLGVTVACGSDAGVFRHGDNLRELELLATSGLGAAGALRAATATAADVLGRQDLGRVAVGTTADLLVVAGDPLVDLAALRAPRMVLSGGKVVGTRR